ncbi:PEP-CTERM sorting domain-containing protein [bacterium]|nr:MAG: PEP-CTERM sorting domain-containing protein [bacterium]
MKPFAVILTLTASTVVLASPRIQDLSGFGGYATALAGRGTGGGANAGDNLENQLLAGLHDADWGFFTSGSASASASYSDSIVTASATSFVGLGQMHLYADNSGPNSGFRYGGGSGGWIDTLTINSAGLTGTAGRLVYTLDVEGMLKSTGFSGASRIQILEYKDKQMVPRDSVFDSSNDPLEVSTDRQMVVYGVASDFSNEHRTIDKTVTFTVPFTYGTPFELGIFANAVAGARSSSGVGGISTAEIDFKNTILWNGISSVLDPSGQGVSDFSIVSASGTDWTQPVPEPGTMAALTLGVAALLRRRKGQ